MDHVTSISKSIEYIHANYNDAITVSDIAESVYLSPSYFATIFRGITGYSVNEYLSKYRLYKVADQLLNTNERIVVIAFENGFSSQQALTRAFSQHYGMGPAQFRQVRPTLKELQLEDIFLERGMKMRKFKRDLGKYFDKVEFIKKDKFFVIGIETDINYNNKNGTKGISGLYNRWNEEKIIDLIPDQVNEKITYGMTYETTEEDTAKYMVAVEVKTLENIPSIGVVGKCFDACEYAVFECTLEDETNGSFYQYFFTDFLKKYNLELPESITTKKGVTYTKYPVFEVYNSDFKDESSMIKIYAPILRK